MAKIDVNKVELVWPGKYNDDGTLKEVPRVNLPFQVIERVNESRVTREARKRPQQASLFDTWDAKEGVTFDEGWRNKLIWGDNLLVMTSLAPKFAGKVDLIYVDPPFATGVDFSAETIIGEDSLEASKEQGAIEERVYRDTWGRGNESWLGMMLSRLVLARDLLSASGSIYVHCDWRLEGHVRLLMDEVFGASNYRNTVVWWYKDPSGTVVDRYKRKHDSIFFYAKSEEALFNIDAVRVPYSEGTLAQAEAGTTSFGRIVKVNPLGKLREDVWETSIVNSQAKERLGYPTQKPESLLEVIVKASSDPNSLVADVFSGSGTTLAVAEKLGRRWIGCDLSRFAIHTTRKRLLDIGGCKPFEVLNLGKYERQYWQGVTFRKKGQPQQQELFEYLAFILQLYGSQPVSGMQHLHGKKGRALVHIGAVDAPVTIDEVNAAIDECLALKQTELHVLGWEWEMGMVGMMEPEAKRRGVRLSLLQIPREVMEQQAVDKGDVKFFQLAYLQVEIKSAKKLAAQVVLTEFVVPNTELIPEDVRDKVKRWSDWVDYWAVDWDFREDTFMQGWVAYRTRKERAMPLKSDAHTYPKPGKYTIVVKVIDIFGNDTTQAFEHEVK